MSSYRKPPQSRHGGSEEDVGFGSFEYGDYTDAAALQRLTIARSNSDNDVNQRESVVPCYFPIADAATIASDGLPRRVLIARLSLTPTFLHETNAARATSALLSALITNTTTMPLLAGQAAIFVNNSFICSNNLRTIMPNERWTVSLGVDPAVKIDYRPAKITNEKVRVDSCKPTKTKYQKL